MKPVVTRSRRAFALLAAVPAILALAACSPAESSRETPPKPAIVVQPKASGSQTAVYPGEVRARHEPALAFRVGGEVTQRLVQEGDRVKKGQALATLDAEDLALQRDSARAQLAAAQAEHRNARSEADRFRTLFERKLVGESQFDAAQTRLDASAAQLTRARSQLEVASNQVDYATLRAPRDGVVTQRMIEVGQVVSPGQAVFHLAVDGEREVHIHLPEQQIDQFRVGQDVTLELWSRPGAPFPGQIREISPAADSTLRTFEARVAFNHSDAGAELGQSARVYIQGGGDSDAHAGEQQRTLSVPMAAVTADNGSAHIWKLDRETSTLHRVPVAVSSYGAETALVRGDMRADDWILAAGTQLVREGQRVRPVDRNNRPIEFGTDLALGL
ncbi:efflux RND transporter periplasmic adaptor subunit [uncultured Microbulbifer sp.]|uniref:efflux RND transporter periplasmic adaptor subunit n=1 Tax=uncultured Microbulbifer sp. TaxID=348147 RepID=UPI0025E8B5EA|nr:efflux RND transporter periplasmic adaptor subunit [uncultured Microbulbifer sp.]